MNKPALEAKTVALLGRYAALDWAEMRDAVFGDGSYSYAAERDLQETLERLVREGTIGAYGRWGPFYRVMPTAVAAAPPATGAATARREAARVPAGRRRR